MSDLPAAAQPGAGTPAAPQSPAVPQAPAGSPAPAGLPVTAASLGPADASAQAGPLRVVLADDDELGRQHLQAYIKAMNREGALIEVVGLCADGREAVTAVTAARPDVLFLDVSMPLLDGFGVIAELVRAQPQHLPEIVLVTAYDQHAVRAFDVGALDFLHKPLSRERFAQAVARARTAIAQRRQGELLAKLLNWIEAGKLPLPR